MLKRFILGISTLLCLTSVVAEEIKIGNQLDVSLYREVDNSFVSMENEKVVNILDEKDKMFNLKKVYLNEKNEIIAIIASSEENLKLKTLEACKRVIEDRHVKYQKENYLITFLENPLEWGYEYSKTVSDRDIFMAEFDRLTEKFSKKILENKTNAKSDFIKEFKSKFSESIDLKNLSCEFQNNNQYVIKSIEIGDMLEYFLLELDEKAKEIALIDEQEKVEAYVDFNYLGT